MDESNIKSMSGAYEQGRYSEALEIAEEYLQHVDGYDWDAIIMKARILSLPDPKFCDYNTAIGMAIYGLDYHRTDVRRWVGLADVFDNCGLYVEAERCYRTALEMDPTNYDAIIGLAVLQNVDYPSVKITSEEMAKLLETAISNEPDKWFAYLYFARILRKSGDRKKAMELYRSAILRLPDTEDKFTRMELEKEMKIFKEE